MKEILLFRRMSMRNKMKAKLRITLGLCFLILSSLTSKSSTFPISDNAKFSVLTCTPGRDLYSLFGHSAIRFQDNVNGQMIDWVYNYGTFEFDDDFYWKFAMGKLDYLLSKEDFPYFQQSYIIEGRGIYEQDLLLTVTEKQRLFDLLEENYLPQNRTYRYDFFYDNCSSRIRDIIGKALNNQVDYTYQYKREHTFRQAIQSYLDYQPWSDFGIDIALGMPCDYKVGKGEMMFLPDSLMHEMQFAKLRDQPLAPYNQEILPADFELSKSSVFTPLLVFFFFLIIHLALGFFYLKNGRTFQITDRLLLFVTGMIGVLVVFLWFFTDHNATVGNLNILWANPINLIVAFASAKKSNGWRRKYMTIYCMILIATLLFWFVLPQRLHLSVISLVVALIFTCIKVIRPQFLSNSEKIRTA